MGGSKSYTCLLKALQYVQDPAARVLIVRESFPLLKLPGGLIDESQGIYRHFGAVWRVQTTTWIFPNGAEVKFAPIPLDVNDWRGLQATHILVDEGHDQPLSTILFLLGRIRSGSYKGHMGLIITCNPDKFSFLFDWVEEFLDEDGVPKEGTENITKYFVNTPDGLKWGKTKEELFEKHGEGKTLGVDFLPISFRFIPMLITDNPTLLKNNPNYMNNLLAMNRVEQLKYRFGSWTAVPSAESYCSRDDFNIIESPPTDIVSIVRSWDLAASEISEVNRDPDYTAGVLLARTASGRYVIMHVTRFRKGPSGVLQGIKDTAFMDGLDVLVTIPRDPGQAAKHADTFMLRELGEAGLSVRSIPSSGHTGKIKKFLPVATVIKSGSFDIVRDRFDDRWIEPFLSEIENFDGSRKRHEDMVDALSDAFNTLAKANVMPVFSIPTLEQASPIPRI